MGTRTTFVWGIQVPQNNSEIYDTLEGTLTLIPKCHHQDFLKEWKEEEAEGEDEPYFVLLQWEERPFYFDGCFWGIEIASKKCMDVKDQYGFRAKEVWDKLTYPALNLFQTLIVETEAFKSDTLPELWVIPQRIL